MNAAIPLATYRVQLTRDFDFDAAAELAPYLAALGITHLYASPFLAARAGSTHGYDIVDHNRISPELGGEEGFERLSAALRDAGLGLILDFVPNHMGIGFADNPWWLDVLEWGQASPHAASFDIDWNGLPYRRRPGVLLPILGRPYGEALAAGEIALRYDPVSGDIAAWHYQHKLPINPQRYDEIIRLGVEEAGAAATAAGAALLDLAQRVSAPDAPGRDDAPRFKAELAGISGAPEILERGLAAYRPSSRNGVALLHRLLERQHYRVADWRVAFAAINYRRFFDVNDLAAIRPERPETFRAMHRLVARLVSQGKLQGLRLDHIDGLRDPMQYARRLRKLLRGARTDGRDCYVVVEKILARQEEVPTFAGVAGTTGYERMDAVTRLLVDGAGLEALDQYWRRFCGETATIHDIVRDSKARVVDTMLASEFEVLARALARIAAGNPSTRDYTLNRLRAALLAYVLEFSVYRTYIAQGAPTEKDRRLIDEALSRARARWQGPDHDIFAFLRAAATVDLAARPGFSALRVRDFALRLQQFTSPLAAKAIEDTAFYRIHRLIALNEVGAEPDAGAIALPEFHALQKRFLETEPYGLFPTATHDGKRGEDARMRILALSELHEDWMRETEIWSELNRRDATETAITAAHEYMLYQALIGAWPLGGIDQNFVAKFEAYALKAAREGKQQTSWTSPDPSYEAALRDFVRRILDPARSDEFLTRFNAFARRTALIGALKSLSQLAVKTMAPGVPDFYQGTEYWDLSLVDPDNRRRVDYAQRRAAMGRDASWPELTTDWESGRIKFSLMQRLLDIRRRHRRLLVEGTYAPVRMAGAAAADCVAFARRRGKRGLIVVALRRFAVATRGGLQWPIFNPALVLEEAGSFHTLLDGGSEGEPCDRDLSKLFGRLPIAILHWDATAAPRKVT